MRPQSGKKAPDDTVLIDENLLWFNLQTSSQENVNTELPAVSVVQYCQNLNRFYPLDDCVSFEHSKLVVADTVATGTGTEIVIHYQ